LEDHAASLFSSSYYTTQNHNPEDLDLNLHCCKYQISHWVGCLKEQLYILLYYPSIHLHRLWKTTENFSEKYEASVLMNTPQLSVRYIGVQKGELIFPHTLHISTQIKEDKTGRFCSMCRRNEKCIQHLVGKPERKRPCRRPRYRQEDIRIDFRETGWEVVNCILLDQESNLWWDLLNVIMSLWVP
jgi:hypothetical protein